MPPKRAIRPTKSEIKAQFEKMYSSQTYMVTDAPPKFSLMEAELKRIARDHPAVPLEHEISAQLEKITSSKLFIANENSSNLLRLIVGKALQGHPISQSRIALEFDAKKHPLRKSTKGNINRVHVTANTLRKLLKEHYVGDGKEDPVLITLPEPPAEGEPKLPSGTAYKPRFAYNPNFPVETNYLAHFPHVKSLSPNGAASALGYLLLVIRRAPNHKACLASLAECMCVTKIFGRKHSLPTSLKNARRAIRIDPNYWRGHAALGVANMCLMKWRAAAACFSRAISCDAAAMKDYLWFAFYLYATDGPSAALSFLNDKAARFPDDMIVRRTLAFFFYADRRYIEAEKVVNFSSNPDDWVVILLDVLLGFAPEGTYPYWDNRPDQLDLIAHLDERTRRFSTGATHELCLGLEALARSQRFGRADAKLNKILAHLKGLVKSEDGDPVDSSFGHAGLALAYMASETPQKAFEPLAHACEFGTIFMPFFLLSPLLDPLRGYPQFQKLLESFSLPKRPLY